MAGMIFGQVQTEDGHAVAAGLAIDAGRLHLTTDIETIGSWPIDSVRIEPIDSHTVRITVEGDAVDFVAEDDLDVVRMFEARRLGTSSLWLAADPKAWARAERRVAEPQTPSLGHRLAPVLAAGVSTVIAFFGFGLMQSPAEAEPTQEPATTTMIDVATTIAVPAGVPEVIAPPGTPLIETTTRWNALAAEYETGLIVADGARTGSWDRVSVEFSVTEFGMLSGALLTGDPDGDGHSDRRILVAMGQMVGAVDPSLDGPARRALLARLGLDVGSPRIANLDGTTTENDIVYRLWYDSTARAIHFSAELPPA